MVHCPYWEQFWTDFKSYFFSLTGQRVQLSMRDVLFGIVTSKCTLLNYLLLVGKLFLWECRRNKVLPNIYGFQTRVGIKYETEKFICTKNNKLHQFHRKWTIITLQLNVAVFSRARLSRLTFLKVFCLLTSLSDLKMIGVFTSKIVFHLSNLRRAGARIN